MKHIASPPSAERRAPDFVPGWYMVRQFGGQQRRAAAKSVMRHAHCASASPVLCAAAGGLSSPARREVGMQQAASSITVRTLPAAARIAALADPGSVAPIDDRLAAPRPSPHLERWGIEPHNDDGIALARATIDRAPVLVAAQDERFLGGSAGVRHAEALLGLFGVARRERPAAVVVLAASGGVRLHEANPAELALARALAGLLDLRAAGVPVLSLGVGDVFGGASVLACAAEEIALLPGARLGLSGPKVIETTHGRGELAADDAAAVGVRFGAEARAAAGQVALLADNAEAVRAWILAALRRSEAFAERVVIMHARLAERLARTTVPPTPKDVAFEGLPPALVPLFAAADPVDVDGWLWRLRDRPVWITRPPGTHALGPRIAHRLDAALLTHVTTRSGGAPGTVFIVCDSRGHETTASAESLCISQYLAQHAAVLALLRAHRVRIVGLLAGAGHSAAFFANALQAPRVLALEGARVVAMEPAAIARVTGLDGATLAARIEADPLVGHAVRHFAKWGGVAEILPDATPERLLTLVDDGTSTPLAPLP
jgi:malonate decarboxylase beta subunit